MVGMRQCGENNCKVRFLSCSKALYAVLKECFKETVKLIILKTLNILKVE